MDNKEYMKNYYLKNKTKHLEYMAEKIKCDCGKSVGRCYLAKHKRTEIHCKKMEEIKFQAPDNELINILKEILKDENKTEEFKNKILNL